ncbi:metalloregulator ArsR/SmtB family transcription factor [Coleofasciculus sp. FACHB-T130]|uniref:ArsR/SmtB family transcription factor n=1 Tax=Cyanophyceae TaxID=3028117 RepID=UPI0016845AB5|nr:metalloregulator ArsR/SmtB family transcription factor [Coleofasciculus sp. FACHB-T130]MBD1879209.1 winged helix-turn-helix transcriptional regulator [Coleofasciculus sp. FACHB-T130]
MSTQKVSSQSFCAQKLKTLADSTRLEVLELLMSGPKHVGEMNAVLGLQQSLLSHHLKVLREEGFVTATRDGKAVLYQLDPAIQRTNADRAIDLGCCLVSFDSNT